MLEMLTDEEVIERYKDLDHCRHGTKFKCESCLNDSYTFHSALSSRDSFKVAADLAARQAGDAFMKDKPELAEALKALAKRLQEWSDEKGREVTRLSKEQRR